MPVKVNPTFAYKYNTYIDQDGLSYRLDACFKEEGQAATQKAYAEKCKSVADYQG